MSHGDHESHREVVEKIRKYNEFDRGCVAILLDTKVCFDLTVAHAQATAALEPPPACGVNSSPACMHTRTSAPGSLSTAAAMTVPLCCAAWTGWPCLLNTSLRPSCMHLPQGTLLRPQPHRLHASATGPTVA